MIYPAITQSAEELFTSSWRYYWLALKQIFLFILVFVVIKALYTHLPALPAPVEIILSCLVAAIFVFLLAMSLYRVDCMFRGVPLTVRQTWDLTLQSILKLYLVCIIIAAIFFIIFFLGHFIIFSWAKLNGAAAGIGLMVIVGVPLILMLIYFILTIPLAVLYPQPLLKIFYHSGLYAHHRFVLLLLIYVEMVIMFAVTSTNTRHAQWLLSHHLMEVTDLVVFCLFLPLLINLTLLLLHDSRLRVK